MWIYPSVSDLLMQVKFLEQNKDIFQTIFQAFFGIFKSICEDMQRPLAVHMTRKFNTGCF